ncbi:hypothetical protein SDC9_86625 [bioreactor metagenome]|uniref:Uncharacterized protein n=1 Tax=bioreactor metagenome TaxID=1076179 RepID=A0A644ZGZ5_9ZZZZ
MFYILNTDNMLKKAIKFLRLYHRTCILAIRCHCKTNSLIAKRFQEHDCAWKKPNSSIFLLYKKSSILSKPFFFKLSPKLKPRISDRHTNSLQDLFSRYLTQSVLLCQTIGAISNCITAISQSHIKIKNDSFYHVNSTLSKKLLDSKIFRY